MFSFSQRTSLVICTHARFVLLQKLAAQSSAEHGDDGGNDALLAEDGAATADLNWQEPPPSPLVQQVNALGMSAPLLYAGQRIDRTDFKAAVDPVRRKEMDQKLEEESVRARYIYYSTARIRS
jgi:hypothetical protein